jgi:H+/Cl- antiporter ClcA
VGAALGRLWGLLCAQAFDGAASSGTYALIGAAGVLGAQTRLTVCCPYTLEPYTLSPEP